MLQRVAMWCISVVIGAIGAIKVVCRHLLNQSPSISNKLFQLSGKGCIYDSRMCVATTVKPTICHPSYTTGKKTALSALGPSTLKVDLLGRDLFLLHLTLSLGMSGSEPRT